MTSLVCNERTTVNLIIQPFLLAEKDSIVTAMQRLNETAEKILFITDAEQKLLGSVTDGDIRRWILAGGSLSESASMVCNKEPFTVHEHYQHASVKELMVENRLECVPVVNELNVVIELLFWRDVFQENISKPFRCLNIPVTIMAGGKGTRLDPFTRILPKPLIPIGDKPIIEIIIEKFREYDISQFYISVNHKAKIIKSFFEELNPSYNIQYIDETIPLGTAGSLKYLQGKVQGAMVVTNCDIIINSDYAEIIDYHLSHDHDITLVASLKRYSIPYGICNLEKGGALICIDEKPEYSFLVNTGFYVLKTEILELIPENTFFHMTHLIEAAKKAGRSVGVFPVSENSWIDTGEWDEYRKAVDKMLI